MTRLPAPATTPLLGHLWRWTSDPVRLLRDGARAGPVFRLRLWRTAVVGYRPDWNRALLGDLETFRSRGSLSRLTPYLAHGVVAADVPGHDERRRQLNPHFHRRAMTPMLDRLSRVAAARVPDGTFDALEWSGAVTRQMLNAAFFDGRLPGGLLAEFLAPLERPLPQPLLPRPVLFRRIDRAIARLVAEPPAGSLTERLADLPGAAEEIRVALAAGFDTTAHTLAWALWHLATAPDWRVPAALPLVLDEVLRLYPAGWLGSRVAVRDAAPAGVPVPAGTLVLYSPLLTHRDPTLWPEPDAFRPERFAEGRPAWAFLPFSAGRRTCLGAHLARAMLTAAMRPFCSGGLAAVRGDPAMRPGLTLRPVGPLVLARG